MGVTGGVLAGFLRFMISIVRLSKADLKVRLYDNRGRSTDVEVGLPVEASAQGTSIDQIIVMVHWVMLVMFVGWSARVDAFPAERQAAVVRVVAEQFRSRIPHPGLQPKKKRRGTWCGYPANGGSTETLWCSSRRGGRLLFRAPCGCGVWRRPLLRRGLPRRHGHTLRHLVA